MLNSSIHLTLAALLLTLSVTRFTKAEAVKDREGAVRAEKAKMENDARWIWEDVPKGFEEAKRTGKPLLVVLRCVPCLACMGIDASVLTDESLSPLLDQFVCVRVINANALDLSLFQMDTDLSFSAMFFNSDRTVYARYGSWKHQKDSADSDISSFRIALQMVLSLHQDYPANKHSLAGKQPTLAPLKSAVEILMLADKYKTVLDWEGKVVQSCVHCHMIGDANRAWYRDRKQPMPDHWLFPFPAPATAGLVLKADSAATLESVIQGSAAEIAGLKAGDHIERFCGQPIVSAADISWVLHTTPSLARELPAEISRNGDAMKVTLRLGKGWRELTDNTGRVGIWPMRGMAMGGLKLVDVPEDVRKARQIPNDSMALLVEGLGQYGKHGTAKRVGFLKDDILLSVDGISARLTESQVHAHLLRKRFPGETVSVNILRGSETKSLQLPMQ